MSDYNGWTNRATWLVNVHLNNDKWSYDALKKLKQNRKDLFSFEEILRQWVYDFLSEETKDPFANDMISYAVNEVNWRELAERYWNEEL